MNGSQAATDWPEIAALCALYLGIGVLVLALHELVESWRRRK